jgi:Adenine deaminase
MGAIPADLIIEGASLVEVNTGRILRDVDVAVKRGFVALVGDASGVKRDASTKVVAANGRYLVPGFIDTHMHIESTMVDPRSFAAGVLPHGTTTICPDNHEIANVFGLEAVKLFHEAAQGLPIKMLLAMPVCVPSIPGFEDAGATLGAEEVAEAYENGWAQLQGEQMNFPGVIYGDPAVHAITAASLQSGAVLTGHYASLELNAGLNAFVASGMTACHESTTAESALAKAERGMYAQQRFGSAWLDMPNTLRAITENPGIDSRYFTMVTDDVTPATVAYDGHLDRVVCEAIRRGLDPVKAIQMVTINAAQLLERSRWIGSIAPGRAADMLLVSDLGRLGIDEVYADGVLVASGGEMVVGIPRYAYPEWALDSVHLSALSPADFRVRADDPKNVRVMRIHPGMVHTTEELALMSPAGGNIEADPARDIAKAALLYRHGDSSVAGSKGMGFVSGAGFAPGSAYASTVSHDCHNLLVLGSGDEAMATAANAVIGSGGGIAVVVGGKLAALMPLPLAGLMSLEPVEVAAKQVREVEAALKAAGCAADSIEMTFSLLGLIVLEELHLSNRGLVALRPGRPPEFVSLFAEKGGTD